MRFLGVADIGDPTGGGQQCKWSSRFRLCDFDKYFAKLSKNKTKQNKRGTCKALENIVHTSKDIYPPYVLQPPSVKMTGYPTDTSNGPALPAWLTPVSHAKWVPDEC